MATADEVQITPGMQAYIDKNNAYLAERDKYIEDVVRKWKFDTIAVHGMYTMQDALEDYQGSIIEPIFMSSSDPHVVLLADRQPLDLLLRMDPGAAGGVWLSGPH
ncbi:MAG: hypothetical protein ACYTAQ_11520 [Planctomycetota bacterium]|jgi:O-acetylhomoserine (thiol)-lyase